MKAGVTIKECQKEGYTHVVQWHQGGRRRAYCKSLAEAKKVKRAKEAEVRSVGANQSPIKPEEWSAVVTARRYRMSLQKLVDAEKERMRQELNSGTIDEAVAERLRFLERDALATGKDQHLTDQRYRLLRFSAAFSGTRFSQVTVAALQQWIDGLGLSPQSLKNMARAVSPLWVIAMKHGWALSNLVQDLSLPPIDKGEIGILTPDQLEELFAMVDADWYPFVGIAAFCGLRMAEVSRLDWREVEIERGYIEVTAWNAKRRSSARTAARRLVDIPDNLASILRAEEREGGAVMPRNGKLKRARKAVSYEWPDNALRHSFATYHLAKHQSADYTALQLGHTDTKLLFSTYRELATREVACAWFDISPVG